MINTMFDLGFSYVLIALAFAALAVNPRSVMFGTEEEQRRAARGILGAIFWPVGILVLVTWGTLWVVRTSELFPSRRRRLSAREKGLDPYMDAALREVEEIAPKEKR